MRRAADIRDEGPWRVLRTVSQPRATRLVIYIDDVTRHQLCANPPRSEREWDRGAPEVRPHLQDPRWSKPKGQGVEGTLITRIYASCHFWEQQFLDQLLVLYPGGE